MCAMIDFISITKRIYKDSLYLGNCKLYNTYSSGRELYCLEGCEKMKVAYNPSTSILELCGSLPYFFKGHNFTFSTGEMVDSIETLDTMLGGVGLWGGRVECFENGVIMPVEAKPKEYITRHYASPSSKLNWRHNEKYKGNFEWWQDGGADIKLYDAGANLTLKQGFTRRKVIEQDGWNPSLNYLKFEVRYTKPDWLNGNSPIRLERLQNEDFLTFLREDLMEKYHKLTPARELVYPEDKREFTSLDAVLITLAEEIPLDEIQKRIYATINNAECLTKCDKDGRKAQIRKAVARLQQAPASKWDLTTKIEDAFELY